MFASSYPRARPKIWRAPEVILLLIGLGIVVLSLTDKVIPEIIYRNGIGEPYNTGLLYTIQSAYVAFPIIGGSVVVARRWKRLSGRERLQLSFIVTGFIIGTVMNVATGLFMTVGNNSGQISNLLGALSILIIGLFCTIAIVKHRLFDVKPIIAKAVAYVLSLFVASFIVILPAVKIAEHFASSANSNLRTVLQVVVILLFGQFFLPLSRVFNRLTSRIFYVKAFDNTEVLEKYINNIQGKTFIKDVVDYTEQLIKATYNPAWMVIILGSGQDVKTYGDNKHFEISVEHMREILHMPSTVTLLPEPNLKRSVSALLSDNDVDMIVRIEDSKQPQGIILFGPKKSGSIYTKHERRLAEVLSKYMSLALTNAQNFSEIRNFAHTLTDRVNEATESLKESNQALEQLSTAKDEFISMASHQIRPQLTAVRGFIDILQQSRVSKDQRDLLEFSGTGIERSLRIIADMLNLSRFSSGKLVIDKRPIDLVELVENEVRQLQPLITTSGVKMRVAIDLKDADVEADEIKIREVIANMLHNAIQYSPAKTEAVASVVKKGTAYRFTVRDFGMGVPKDEVGHLFEKFYRTSSAKDKRPAGTGIGLFLAKTVVEAHGGRVFYEPADPGSVFGFELPAAK